MVEKNQAERGETGRGNVVAGIDVGGTFTDLILIDARGGGVSASPRRRPHPTTRPSASSPHSAETGFGRRRHRPHRPRHHDHHQRRAGAPARPHRHDHHARLSRHHRAWPPHAAAGLRHDGHFRAGHPAQSAAGSLRTRRGVRRGAHAARRRRGEGGGRDSFSPPAASRWSSTSCIPTPTPRMSAAPPRSRQKLWPNGYITTGHSLLSEAREFERGVTAAVNASVQPILERYVHRLRERAGAAGLPARLPDHERQWRHDLGAFRRARCGQDRDVRPGFGRHRRRLYRQARRPPEPRHLRHGRHLDRRRADPRRRARRLQRDRDRICDADPCADGRRAHGRRRRRLDRARRCVRPDPGRAGKRRRQSRPDLLRPRRHGADHHRRQSAARPARSRNGCSPSMRR